MTPPAKSFSTPLAERIASEIGPELVSENRADKINYARDLWPLDTVRVREGTVAPSPDVVVWPQREYHIQKILEIARTEKVPVIPYGAGSGVCGGTTPLFGGIILDMKKMNRLVRIDDKSLTAEVETGIVGEIFERELNRKGYTVGHFPSSMYCSTVGGWLATRGAGQLSSKYGKAEDRVLALRAVLSSGEIVETVKAPGSATGPDWAQAIVGSEGTYGVITKAWMKVAPYPQSRLFHAFYFPDLAGAIDAVRRIFQGGVKPAACRLYDPVDTFIAGQGKSAITENTKRRGIADRILEALHDAPLDIPREVLPRLANRPRKLNDLIRKRARKSKLVLTFEGPEGLAEIERNRAVKFCLECNGEDLGPEPARKWWNHRYAVSYAMSTVFDLGLFVDTMEVATNWSNLENLYDKVMATLGKHAFAMAHFSHAYPQGCSIYFTFAAGAPKPADMQAKYRRIWDDALETVMREGGVVSHHHGIGALKQRAYSAQQGEAMRIVRGLKKAFDPEGVLNPGKLGL